MTTQTIKLEDKYCAHNYAPLPVVLTRGDGVYLWDDQGNRFVDMLGAYSAMSHGHANPRLLAAMMAQAQRLSVPSRAFHTDALAPFLKRACELTGQDMALPMNTGAEAVETALKAARKWAYEVKGVATDKAEIIACEGNFHGRTIAIVAMSSDPQYRDGFGPFPAGFKTVPFGDPRALEAAITPNTAAFLVEPIQGEGGIVMPPKGYLAACARICRDNDVLLICDEIQTGLGRTGKLLASEHEGVTPDGLILGKALGGGLMPVSLFLARRDVMKVFHPGDHGSTFGGSAIAAAVGLEALDMLIDEGLIDRSAELGDHMLRRLKAFNSPVIREVRGLGLFAGVEFHEGAVSAHDMAESLMHRGVLTKETRRNTIRFAPPLVITRDQIDWALDQFADALNSVDSKVPEPAGV